jgi:hypothetical protein
LGSKRGAQVRRVDSSGGGSRRTYIIIGLIAAVFIAGFAALVILDAREKSMSTPPGTVKSYDVGPAGQHTEADVDYEQNPPVGGAHNPVWQNCGYYDQPVRDENAVHDLEHGTVWITHDPDLSDADREALAEQLPDNGIMSPREDLPSPVVVTVWGAQLRLDGADDRRLGLFLEEYGDGHTAPEYGVSCQGGTPDPQGGVPEQGTDA